MLAQGLADSAPGQAISVLRGPLTQALKDVQQDQDRPRTFAAAEAMSGLLASSSSYAGRPVTDTLEIMGRQESHVLLQHYSHNARHPASPRLVMWQESLNGLRAYAALY